MKNRVTIKWESLALPELVAQKALAQLLIDKQLITKDELLRKVKETRSASAGLPDLTVGNRINIDGIGERFSGDYYVEKVNHTANSRGYKIGLVLAQRPETHRVKKRETLKSIAKKYYGSPDGWRRIAKDNDIEDPRRLTPGTLLTIPRLDSDEDEQ